MLVKHNNNSISNLTSPGQLAQGKMTLISSQTASGSASISFTSGIDSTYPIYRFEFINLHPATDNTNFQFQTNSSGGSGYNETITSTFFNAVHKEDDAAASIQYQTPNDQAQGTAFQDICLELGNDNDQTCAGFLHLFNPSNTTFVKHFISRFIVNQHENRCVENYSAGYINTTVAIDEIQFKMSSGNIDAGTIKLYGIKGD